MGPRRVIKNERGGECRFNSLIDPGQSLIREGRTKDRFRHNMQLVIPRHSNILASVPYLNRSSKAGMTETDGLLTEDARQQKFCPKRILQGMCS
jgi:hypothetical protein